MKSNLSNFVNRIGFSKVAILFAMSAFSVCQAAAQGVGDLLIAPTRVVFEGPKRSAEINLTNIGNTPSTYRISLIHQRMSEDGKLEEVQTAADGEKFADDLVRFTPRQVVLEPKSSQVVRIQLRLPAELDNGEYRSHILFRAVPVPGSGGDAASSGAATGLSIKVVPIYGVSIPLIVRHGVADVKVSMSGLNLHTEPDGSVYLIGRLNRTGSCSSYGDMNVEFEGNGGPTRTLALSNGVAVYAPNSARNFVIKLTLPEGLHLNGGVLHVSYRQPVADGHALLAEDKLSVK